jgi:hypothetical protein
MCRPDRSLRNQLAGVVLVEEHGVKLIGGMISKIKQTNLRP